MAVEHPVDFGALRRDGHTALTVPEATEATLFDAIWSALRACRKGHITWRLDAGCGEPGRPQVRGRSVYGLCAAGAGTDFVITKVASGNPLGLARGDRVIAVDGLRGEEMITEALRQPTCGLAPFSETARDAEAAMLLSANVREGTRLTILGPNGETRSVTAGPNAPGPPLDCYETEMMPSLEIAHDDVAVLRVPSFTASEDSVVTKESEAAKGAFVEALEAHMAEANAHRAVVVDVRRNRGGLGGIALALAGVLPGARAVDTERCELRFEGRYLGPELHRFEPQSFRIDPPTVVLVDGGVASAGDLFARLVRIATDTPLVGTPTLGMYTLVTYDRDPPPLEGTEPPMHVFYSPERCFALDGSPFEARGTEPDLRVEPDPTDLAKGVDTQLERAIALALAPETERAALIAARAR